MKKKLFTVCVFIAVLAVLSVGCFSCGSKAESTSEAEAAAEGGDASLEVGGNVETGDVAIGTQKVKTVVEAPYTLAELIRDVYKDTFTRIVICVLLVMWFTGNLHPAKGFSIFPKKD